MNKIKALVVGALFFAQILIILPVPTVGLTVHAPIYIDGDADFASKALAEGWEGNGSIGNPYIIENYDINASTAHGIEIRNTSVYFIIRNCTIHDGLLRYHGIYLYNVTNGKTQNVSCYNNLVGIRLYSSANNNITTNHIYNNSGYGIQLWDFSSNNLITTNQIYNNSGDGIELWTSSSNNLITTNHIYNNRNGVYLHYPPNNNITTNLIHDNSRNGIRVSDSNSNLISANRIYHNARDGVYLDLSSDNNLISANQIYNNSDDGIHFSQNSDSNNIISNQIYNNNYGIKFYYNTHNNIISSNRVYNNTGYGIYLYDSTNNILRNNILEKNTYNFGVYWAYLHEFYQDIDTSNTINGKPIYYIMGQNNLVFDETTEVGYLGLVSCSNVLVKNLTISNNGQGLLLANTSYSTITSNHISDSSEGIYIASSSMNNIIAANQVYNNSVGGIEFFQSTNNDITTNQIYGNGDGISLRDSLENNVTSNMIYSNSRDGIHLFNSLNNNITSNKIYNNSCMGINISQSLDNHITTNWIYNNTHGIEFYYASKYNIIASNQIYNNSEIGILLYSSSENNITTNQIYGNSKNGISLYHYSLGNEIHYNNIWNNTDYGIYSSQYIANATYNWWGSASGPEGMGPGTGDNISMDVLYKPWLIEPVDFTSPTIIHTSPNNGEIDVPVDTEIVIKFSERMNISTIPGNITIEPYPGIQNYHWSNYNTTFTMTFVSNLSCYTSYTIAINTNVKGFATVMDSSGVIHYLSENYLRYPYQFSFRTMKDIMPPTITIISPLNGTITNQNITLIYTISDDIDILEHLTIIGPANETVYTDDGTYTITITAKDRANNLAEKTISFTIDKTAPSIDITGVVDGFYYNVDVTPLIDITDVNLNITSTKLNSVDFVSGTTITEEGNYTLAVWAVDKANNIANITISFTIDKTSPDIIISGVVDGVYYNINVTPIIDVTDANPNATSITLNGAPFIAGSRITEDGEYVLAVEAIDKAGNTIQKKISFTIDKTPPEAVTIKVAKRTKNSITLTWDKNIDKDFDKYELWKATKEDFSDAVLIANITDRNDTTFTITGLSPGAKYYFKIKVVDNAGNEAYSDIVSVATLKKEMIEPPWLLIWVLVIMIMAVTVVATMFYIRKKM